MQTALYVKIKERKGELLIGAYTQNLLYLSIVATQHKKRQRRVRRVLIMGKARRRARRAIWQTHFRPAYLDQADSIIR